MDIKDKKAIKKQELDKQLNNVLENEYSAEDQNAVVKDINSLKYLNEGEELPYKIARFCQEYVIHYDFEKAANKAGYPLWSAASAGRRLLSDPRVRAEIERLQKQISVKLQITQERVLSEYAKLAYSNIQDFFDENGKMKSIPELDRDIAASIAGLDLGVKKVKDADGNETLETYVKNIKHVDKKAALDALSKHLGIFDKEQNRQMPVDFKMFLSALPKEVQETIKVSLAKKLNSK